MTNTPNYDLEKPGYDDFADVEALNRNFDKIDTAIKNSSDSVNALSNTFNQWHSTDYVPTKAQLTQHLADYEYQTATINGTQIRLTKKSNTSRIVFRLNTSLSGTITVSLNNGTTSVNLVDVDGVQVTSLEKGFHEIFASANFFILRNKGGLTSEQLQALITINNEAEENESVLRTNYVNAVNSADESISLPDNATWNDILLQIPNIKPNSKKMDIGTVVSSSANLTFRSSTGTTTLSHPYVTVTGLGFTPTSVILRYTASATVVTTNTSRIDGYYLLTSNGVSMRLTENAYLVDGGFQLPVNTANTRYEWVAYQ